MKILYYNLDGNLCRFIYTDKLNTAHLVTAQNIEGLRDFLILSDAKHCINICSKYIEINNQQFIKI